MNLSKNLAIVALTVLVLGGCATAPVEADCEPLRAWQQGLDGKTAMGRCDAADQRVWQEASNLGLELRQLVQQRQILKDQSDASNSLQFARVQREIDQIVGAAQIRGWPLPDRIRKASGH
ncbi:MAG: hypothetical protein AB8B96_10955 [Lysobacterales bacterium]